MSTCRLCRVEKPADRFGWQNRELNIPRATCKECDANATELFGIENDYEARRAARLFLAYGLTPEDEERFLTKQNGACAACGETPEGKRLSVDYCEETATVRGMLCPTCSNAVGRVGADLTVMQRTMIYLRNHHTGIPA